MPQVLDDEGIPISSEGLVGHLWIGGETRKCLIDSEQWSDIPTLRDTGDLVQLLSDGNLRFVGRTDEQIKIHVCIYGFCCGYGCCWHLQCYEINNRCVQGQRIDLAVIETHLEAQTAIQRCKVLTESQDSPVLTAYIEPRNPKFTTEEQRRLQHKLTQSCAMVLPRVGMIREFVFLSRFPVNAHGKLDRSALRQMRPER